MLRKKLMVPILICVTLIWAGAMYFYDFPQLFEGILIQDFNISTVEVSFLYTIAGLPNLFCNILADILIQKIGLGLACTVFTGSAYAGILLCYLGVSQKNFLFMIIGRGVFGAGFEASWLGQSVATQKWFSGSFLSLAYGLNRAIVYMFSAISTYIQPELFFLTRGLEIPMVVYGCVAFLTFLTTVVFAILDIKNETKLIKKDEKAQKYKFRFRDLKKVKSISWLLAFYQAFFSQCFYQCTNFLSDMFVNRYGLNYVDSKNTIAVISLISMITIPIISAVVGKYGKKEVCILLGALVCTITYVLMLFIPYNCPGIILYGVVTLMALFKSLHTACIWSSLVITLPKQAASTVMAISATAQNLFLAGLPPIFAYFNKPRTQEAYQSSLYILAGMGGLSLMIAFAIIGLDKRTGRILHLPENDKRVQQIVEKNTLEFGERIIKKVKVERMTFLRENFLKSDLEKTMVMDDDREEVFKSTKTAEVIVETNSSK